MVLHVPFSRTRKIPAFQNMARKIPWPVCLIRNRIRCSSMSRKIPWLFFVTRKKPCSETHGFWQLVTALLDLKNYPWSKSLLLISMTPLLGPKTSSLLKPMSHEPMAHLFGPPNSLLLNLLSSYMMRPLFDPANSLRRKQSSTNVMTRLFGLKYPTTLKMCFSQIHVPSVRPQILRITMS